MQPKNRLSLIALSVAVTATAAILINLTIWNAETSPSASQSVTRGTVAFLPETSAPLQQAGNPTTESLLGQLHLLFSDLPLQDRHRLAVALRDTFISMSNDNLAAHSQIDGLAVRLYLWFAMHNPRGMDDAVPLLRRFLDLPDGYYGKVAAAEILSAYEWKGNGDWTGHEQALDMIQIGLRAIDGFDDTDPIRKPSAWSLRMRQAHHLSELGLLEQSVRITEDAIALFDARESPDKVSLAYIDLGWKYRDLGMMNESISAYRSAIEYASRASTTTPDTIASLYVSMLNAARSDRELSGQLLYEMLSDERILGTLTAIRTSVRYSRTAMEAGEYGQALHMLESQYSALADQAAHLDQPTLLQEYWWNLAQARYATGDSPGSISAYREFLQYSNTDDPRVEPTILLIESNQITKQ